MDLSDSSFHSNYCIKLKSYSDTHVKKNIYKKPVECNTSPKKKDDIMTIYCVCPRECVCIANIV